MSFALFLAKNVHPSIGEEFCAFSFQKFAPLSSPLNGAEFTLSVAKNVALFETVRILVLLLSNGMTGDRGSETNDRISGRTVLLFIEKMKQINTKNYGNRKKDCAWGCARGINTIWENLQIEKHEWGRRWFRSPDWFVFSICRFSQVVIVPRAQPHAQSLFLFPIVFGINFFCILNIWLNVSKWFLDQGMGKGVEGNKKVIKKSVSWTYYKKRGSASYIVQEVREVRERERERERDTERHRRKWRHLSSAEIGDEFCSFPCQIFAPYFLPSQMALSSHFSLPRTL